MTSYRQPGTVLTDHTFRVPLDYDRPAGEHIEVFAREVVAADKTGADLPWLLFLQGGPGLAAPRPAGRDSWLRRALDDYRVLLLDQRGTGQSTPANRRTLAKLASPAAQAEYLALFRGDNIVRDAERIRGEVTGGAPWSVLGQSFGG
ncbi:MAG: alpha/beta fold hydrolase, partial [Streptosporangiaceae bacterium]